MPILWLKVYQNVSSSVCLAVLVIAVSKHGRRHHRKWGVQIPPTFKGVPPTWGVQGVQTGGTWGVQIDVFWRELQGFKTPQSVAGKDSES